MTIEVLPPSVAAQIAAGEVVERPASVVKELVENALDAGATRISASIAQGGTKLIRVTDNGSGIPADQVVTAFARHATSKLRSAEELLNIGTLGFRGEALPSIAAVSKLTITTCTDGAEAATQYRLNYGEPAGPPQPAGTPTGTSITVEDLFGNQPARLKFLKTRPTEASHAQRVVARYAMAYPDVRFTFVNDGNETFATHGTGKLQETILTIMGHDVAAKMLPVLLKSDDAEVSGYVGNTDLHRSNRNDISVTVNGRWVQDSNLSYAIEQGYTNSLPLGRRPIAVIHLRIPAENVDVNAHPTKQEVRFRHESKVFSAIQRAVHEALSAHGMVHQPASRSFYRSPAAPRNRSHRGATAEAPPHRATDAETVPFPDNVRRSTEPTPRRTPTPDNPLVTADLHPDHNLRDVIPQLRLIGQAQLTFILADGPDGLYVIDQHAAHERVIFDRVLEQRDSKPATSQRLLIPEQVELDAFEHETLVQHHALMIEHGFDVNHVEGPTWVITALPRSLTADRSPNPAHALQKLLDEFAAENIVSSPHHAIAATIACHSAARAGDTLGEAHMNSIIEQLATTPEPHHCPHGRPTIVQISKLRMEQEFRRR